MFLCVIKKNYVLWEKSNTLPYYFEPFVFGKDNVLEK